MTSLRPSCSFFPLVLVLSPYYTVRSATLFNCIQRGHQQALESYQMFLVMSVLGGINYPGACALAGAAFSYSRVKWAEGYATGNPASRYEHWASFGVWGSLLTVMFATGATAVKMLIE